VGRPKLHARKHAGYGNDASPNRNSTFLRPASATFGLTPNLDCETSMRLRSKFLRHRLLSYVALGAMAINVLAPIAAAQAQALSASNGDKRHTRTPIKHLIVVVGENRSFDNVFGTYVPPDPKQSVWNLLSQRIVYQDGTPGLNAAIAKQQKADATNKTTFQLAPPKTVEYSPLPGPSTTLNAIPNDPCDLSHVGLINTSGPPDLFCSDAGLLPSDLTLLTQGGTGEVFFFRSFTNPATLNPAPDCRYPNPLPNNAPYSIVGASVNPVNQGSCASTGLFGLIPHLFRSPVATTVYSDNTGDPVHRFFQMWQQNDCSRTQMSPQNPSGCLHDLYTWVATSVGWQITKDGTQTPPPPGDDQATFQGSVAMGFYNMKTDGMGNPSGDWPYFHGLAQQYAISDNYHQPVMGGTGPNSQFMLTGDVFYYTDSNGHAAPPPSDLIENPDPQPGTNNYYTHASPNIPVFQTNVGDPGNTSKGGLANCSDRSQPGVATIIDYLNSLPYRPFNNGNCAPGHFYQVDNEYPYYDHTGGVIPLCAPVPNPKYPPTQPPLLAASTPPGCLEFPAGSAFSIGPQTIPTIGESLSDANISWKYYGEGLNNAAQQALKGTLYCAICNAFQYSRKIMTENDQDGVPLLNHLVDYDDTTFFADVAAGTLPAVSFVKPDTLLDSHPGTSTPQLYEAFVKKIIQAVQSSSLWQSTAILITFDESGGYYDSGYIQPIDFFGDGPRTVLIAVSPFARKGTVDHTYADHASVLKFIEHNWRLKPLSKRSRDNLPNPRTLAHEPYFPRNAPAIGDLTTMFKFPGGDLF
jgi:phospholipase C